MVDLKIIKVIKECYEEFRKKHTDDEMASVDEFIKLIISNLGGQNGLQ